MKVQSNLKSDILFYLWLWFGLTFFRRIRVISGVRILKKNNDIVLQAMATVLSSVRGDETLLVHIYM